MTDNSTMTELNSPSDPNEGAGKGTVFFERARTVASTGDFDYAIEMYIQGLYREPLNLDEHKNLREVSFHRKVSGGKPAGGLLGRKLPYKGKLPKEGMLNAEWLLAKDVSNITHMLAMVRNAQLMNYRDIVLWMGPILQEANRTNEKGPKPEIYLELAEIYEKVSECGKAAEAAEMARLMKPTDGNLDSLVKRYAAQATLTRGNYEKSEGFTGSIKDREVTKKLLEEENLGRSEEYRRKAVEEARAEYLKNPTEMQVITKYSKALVEMDDESSENEAIDILKKAYETTKIYRFKVTIGDVRIKQINRNIRVLRDAMRSDPNDAQLKADYEQLQKEKLSVELTEYRERAEHFPTDMVVRYEFGRRLYLSGMYDEAIGALQEAQNNPKHRIEALLLLGRSFMSQRMLPEALDTLKRAIEDYELASTGDARSKDLHYWYGRALEENGNVTQAIDVYSQIVRWDIGFMDARKRLTALRDRVESQGEKSA